MPKVEEVTRYSLFDQFGEDITGQLLLSSGYNSPWPGEGWEPNEELAVAGCFQAGETVHLGRHVARWTYGAAPESKPEVRLVESDDQHKVWSLEANRRTWTKIIGDE